MRRKEITIQFYSGSTFINTIERIFKFEISTINGALLCLNENDELISQINKEIYKYNMKFINSRYCKNYEIDIKIEVNMKQLRDIQKTIRINKFLYDEIDKHPGTTWNDKINNLLKYYLSQDKEYKKYLADLEQQIKEKQLLLDNFKSKIQKFEDLFK